MPNIPAQNLDSEFCPTCKNTLHAASAIHREAEENGS